MGSLKLMNEDLLRLEVENLSELFRLKDINKKLLDANYNLLTRLVHECEIHKVPIQPEIEALFVQVRQILNEFDNNRDLTGEKNNRRPNSIFKQYLY